MKTEDIKSILKDRSNAIFLVNWSRSAPWGFPHVVHITEHGRIVVRRVLADGTLGHKWKAEPRAIREVTTENHNA